MTSICFISRPVSNERVLSIVYLSLLLFVAMCFLDFFSGSHAFVRIYEGLSGCLGLIINRVRLCLETSGRIAERDASARLAEVKALWKTIGTLVEFKRQLTSASEKMTSINEHL